MITNKHGLDLNIYDLWYVPFWQHTYFYLATGLVLLLLVMVISFGLYKKLLHKKETDPLAVILDRLRYLESNLQSIKPQVFYFDLIGAYKDFLFYKYNLTVSGRTDTELLECFRGSKEDYVVIIKKIIKSSQEVRFASQIATRSQMEADILSVLEVVHKSKKEKT